MNKIYNRVVKGVVRSDGELHFIQYPAVTVCVYRSDEDEKDVISEEKEFPQGPRDDLITRHIYYFTKSNGFVINC